MALHEFLFSRTPPQQYKAPYTGPSVSERMVAELDQMTTEYNVPAAFTDYLKDDLKKQFTMWGDFAPGYAGAPLPVRINLINLVTDPGKAIEGVGKDLYTAVFKTGFSLEDIPTWFDSWSLNRLGSAWLDVRGNALLTGSLASACNVWVNSARNRSSRLKAEELVRNNPQLYKAMAERLAGYYGAQGVKATAVNVGGASLKDFISRADDCEHGVKERDPATGQVVYAGTKAVRRGSGVAEFLKQGKYADAQDLQDRWAATTRKQREALIKELNEIAKRGRRRGATAEERTIANSAEAKFLRYWNSRSYYYGTVNFLTIWHEDGFRGALQTYAYEWLTTQTFLSKVYPPNVVKSVMAKLASRGPFKWMRGLMTQLTNLRTFLVKLRKKIFTDLLKKGVTAIWNKVIKKTLTWIIMKLGLKIALTKLGAILGSVIPGAGTAAGAVIGGALSFVTGVLLEKLAPVIKPVFYGICGILIFVLVLLCTGAFMVLGAVVLIFNPNAVLPAEAINLPITMIKEACESAPSCKNFENPLQIKKDGKTHKIRWQITVRNGGTEDVVVGFSDEQCHVTANPAADSFTLKKGEDKEFYCQQDVIADTDKVVTNTAEGITIPDNDTFTGVGVVVVGTPAMDFPHTWPLASGCITQGPGGSYSHVGVEAIDINSDNEGNLVSATHNGTVVKACYTDPIFGCPGSAGNNVQVQGASGYVTWYAHLATVNVKVGDTVVYGQPIGTVGNTGNSTAPHLHYEFKGLDMAPPYIPREVPPCAGRADCASMMGGDACW